MTQADNQPLTDIARFCLGSSLRNLSVLCASLETNAEPTKETVAALPPSLRKASGFPENVWHCAATPPEAKPQTKTDTRKARGFPQGERRSRDAYAQFHVCYLFVLKKQGVSAVINCEETVHRGDAENAEVAERNAEWE